MFGKRKQRREAAHKAWVLGGIEASKSLKEEIRAGAGNEIPLPDSSQAGADLLLRMVKEAPEDPLGAAAMYMGSAMKQDTERSDVAKRLGYRQAVLAASILTGTDRNLDVCRDIEDEVLGLSTS